MPKRIINAAQLTYGLAGAVVGLLFVSATLAWRAASSPSLAACGCGQWFVIPASQRLWPSLVLFGLGAITVLQAVLAGWRSLHAERQLRQSFVRQGIQWTEHVPLRLPIGIVSSDEPFAVTVGWWRPSVFISRGLLRVLSKQEIRTVMAHEQAHVRRRDPLRTAILTIIAQAFWYLPWLKGWVEAARAEHEILADDMATEQQPGQVAILASALVKMHDAPLVGAGVAWTPFEARVDRLLDPLGVPVLSPRVRSSLWLAAVLMAGLVGAGFWATNTARAASPELRRCVETRLLCANRPLPPQSLPPMSSYGR